MFNLAFIKIGVEIVKRKYSAASMALHKYLIDPGYRIVFTGSHPGLTWKEKNIKYLSRSHVSRYLSFTDLSDLTFPCLENPKFTKMSRKYSLPKLKKRPYVDHFYPAA